MALSVTEKLNLKKFLAVALSAVTHMAQNTKYPALKTIYTSIADNLQHVPINIKSGSSLDSTGFSTTYGENVKRYNGPFLQSAIRIPHDHLFDEQGNIRNDGALTLLHEESHIVLPSSAHNFTARVGLPAHHADEFFADVLSSHIARNIGFKPEVIGRHLYARRTYFGFPIDRFALEGRKGVAREIESGRFTPRRTLRPETPSPIRSPEEPVSFFPKSRGMPAIFPGSRNARVRRFNPRI